MVVHQDSCKNWLEDNAVEQQGGRGARATPAISFDFGIKSFEDLVSPGAILNMALPQAAHSGILAPLLPLPSEQAGESYIGNGHKAEMHSSVFVTDEEAA